MSDCEVAHCFLYLSALLILRKSSLTSQTSQTSQTSPTRPTGLTDLTGPIP